MTGVSNSSCAYCSHKEVCSLKGSYQITASNIESLLETIFKNSKIDISFLDYEHSLVCKHWSEDGSYRGKERTANEKQLQNCLL